MTTIRNEGAARFESGRGSQVLCRQAGPSEGEEQRPGLLLPGGGSAARGDGPRPVPALIGLHPDRANRRPTVGRIGGALNDGHRLAAWPDSCAADVEYQGRAHRGRLSAVARQSRAALSEVPRDPPHVRHVAPLDELDVLQRQAAHRLAGRGEHGIEDRRRHHGNRRLADAAPEVVGRDDHRLDLRHFGQS